MITIPINVLHPAYLWHLDLFCYAHRSVYGSIYNEKIYSVIMRQHTMPLEFNYQIKYKVCDAWSSDTRLSDLLKNVESGLCVPLNIQIGLKNIINEFDDNAIIELVDHDMVHFKPHPQIVVDNNEFLVCDLYENWHLFSLTYNRRIIDHFIKDNSAKYYNGGFVPIIGRVKTFKKILEDWIDIHVGIITKEPAEPKTTIGWWAGMYSFNAACERNGIKMTAKNYCYIPNINDPTNETYIAHYSVDPRFDKKKYPNVDTSNFLDNEFYDLIKSWLSSR